MRKPADGKFICQLRLRDTKQHLPHSAATNSSIHETFRNQYMDSFAYAAAELHIRWYILMNNYTTQEIEKLQWLTAPCSQSVVLTFTCRKWYSLPLITPLSINANLWRGTTVCHNLVYITLEFANRVLNGVAAGVTTLELGQWGALPVFACI